MKSLKGAPSKSLSPLQNGERAGAPRASEIVCTSNPQIAMGNLPLSRFSSQLSPNFVELGNPGCANRVPFALQSAGGIDRLRTLKPGRPIRNGPAALTRLEEAEIFHVNDLGNREAVMHFAELDILRPKR